MKFCPCLLSAGITGKHNHAHSNMGFFFFYITVGGERPRELRVYTALAVCLNSVSSIHSLLNL